MADSMHEKMMRLHGANSRMKSGHSMDSIKNMEKVSFEVALKGKRQIAEGTYAYIFEKPNSFTFKAGQHVRMTLINLPKSDGEGDSRFFSIASTPQDEDLVFAMRMRDTAFKRALSSMQTGDKVLIQILLNVPPGAFALHDDASKSAVFVVGGIGIVPVYSMIKDASERKLPHKMYLFYSNRRPEDAPFLGELKMLAKQNPNFILIATMTEAGKSAKIWQGEAGRIDSSMIKKYVDDLVPPIYYVAGLPEMVSAMKKMLENIGVSDENVKAEEFTGFNLNEIPKDTERQNKGYLVIAVIALALLAFAFVHGVGVTSVFHGGFGSSSFNNPASYLITGLVLVTIVAKLKLFSMGYRHRRRK